MWRSVGVEKLSGGARLEGVEREEPEAQVSVRVLVRWLLSTCCSGITHDLLLSTPSPGGVVGVWRGLPELLTL